jgi:transposase
VDQSRKEASAMPQPYSVTAGIDLGDRYTHLCLVDGEEGEVIEESRIPTTRRAFERRFSETEPMRVAIEAGTHSPWVSRVLQSCGHDVLVANARKVKLIYGEGKKNDKVDALRSWRVLPGSIPDYLPRYSIVGRIRKHTWRSYARGRRWWVPGPSS